jgi:hypothetical protein
MSLLTLALIVAATNTQPNANGTTTRTNSSKTTLKASKNAKQAPAAEPTDPNAPAPADGAAATEPATPKKPKGKKDEAPAAGADAGDPASLVANTADAATQIANAAAKAAMDEVAKLSAIGGGSSSPSLVDGKTAEAVVTGTTAVAKEVSKAGKEASIGMISPETRNAAAMDKGFSAMESKSKSNPGLLPRLDAAEQSIRENPNMSSAEKQKQTQALETMKSDAMHNFLKVWGVK